MTIHLPKLTREQSHQLAAEISEKEINAAIAHLKSNKAPGPDGFPAVCYKVMKESLIPGLRSTFNWVLKESKRGYLTSWRKAVISLIPKEGKDKLECGNFRPVSVLK